MTETQTAKNVPLRNIAPTFVPVDGDIVVTAAPRGNFIISRADGTGWTTSLDVVLDVTRFDALKRASDFLRPGQRIFFRTPGPINADSFERIERVSLDQ